MKRLVYPGFGDVHTIHCANVIIDKQIQGNKPHSSLLYGKHEQYDNNKLADRSLRSFNMNS